MTILVDRPVIRANVCAHDHTIHCNLLIEREEP